MEKGAGMWEGATYLTISQIIFLAASVDDVQWCIPQHSQTFYDKMIVSEGVNESSVAAWFGR